MARTKKETKAAKDLLIELRDRYKAAVDADSENRRESLKDMKFCNVPGEQWDGLVKKERGLERPILEFNKIRISVKRVVNDMRSNRPQGKIRAFEDGDRDTAEIYEGLCRNIWNSSDGDTAIDMAAEYQVTAGMGAWRVNTKYSTDEAFDQDIVIEPIRNPYCLYADPSCRDSLKRDGEFWILTEKIGKDAFESKYPDAVPVDFEGSEFDDEDEWKDDKSIRVCEYWYRVPKTVQIALLSNGETVDLSTVQPDELAKLGIQVVKQRLCQTHQIRMCIASGDAILEGPTDWAGSFFPFVMIYGENLVIDGRQKWFGLVRFAKDAQRAYNYSRTAIAETIALAPQTKFWATPEQAEGNTEIWAEAHKKLFPFMLYNSDPKAPGPPQRMAGADVPVAFIQEAQIASDEIKAVTGIYDASLGRQSNETSGVAIRSRAAQGEIATFNYMDNMSKGIRRTWEILIDLIPKIYDTERSIRILGQDGAEKYAKVNTIDPATGQALNDLSKGKYDVAITVGPSYATQRQEAVEAYTQIGQALPQLYAVAGDIIMKNMDLPGAEQISERLKAMLPPQIQQMTQDGKAVPPEVQQMMSQAQQAMQQVQQHGQLVQAAQQELDQKGTEITSQQADLKGQLADLAVRQAKFDADVASQLAKVTMAEAQLIKAQCAAGADQQATAGTNERAALAAEVQTALADIKGMAAQFMQDAQATVMQVHAQGQPNVIVHPHPRVTKIVRQNGAMVPIYEDQQPAVTQSNGPMNPDQTAQQ